MGRVNPTPSPFLTLDWYNTKTQKRPGFSLIEVLFAIMLFALISTGVAVLSISTLQKEGRVSVDAEALAYVEEGLEASRNVRDQNYLNLSAGEYGLSLGENGWVFSEETEIIDSFFTRVITVEDVYRDSNGDIVSTVGSLDLNTKKITSEVRWIYGVLPRSLSMSSYLTNWAANDWMQITCTEFSAGTYTNSTNQPAAGPPTDNCVLNLDLIEEEGTFFVSTDIGEHGNDVVVEDDYAYVATAKTQEGLAVVDISDVENPLVLDHVDVDGKGRYLYKYGDVIYMGVESNTKGLAVVDASDPTDIELEDSINIGAYGNQATVSGTTLFMGVEKASGGLVLFDVSIPEAPDLLSTLNLGDKVRSVAVLGDYAYVTTDDTSAGLQVVDVSNTSSPSVVATVDVGDRGNTVWLASPFAYVGTESTSESLQVIDISSPTSPSVLSTLDVGHEIQDLAISGNYLYATLNQVNPGLAVVNVSSPTAPSLSFTVDVGGKGTGVALDGDKIYAGVNTANAGLVIVGQADVSVASSGTYISSAFDTASIDPRYNYLDWDATVVSGSTVEFQIRTASTSGGLSSATWVGPDGTSSSYFDTERTPILTSASASGTQFFQFITYMTSDGFTTPSVNSVTVNYNP